MILRRLAALALSIPLLHLSVARADLSCASHAAEASQPAAQPPVAMEHHAHHEDGQRTPSADPEQCKAPQARDCCASLATCSVSFGSNIVDNDVATLRSSRAHGAPALRAPLILPDAPEPPPPRA